MGECGGLERTDFFTVSMLEGCGGLERTDFIFILTELIFFYCWKGVVVLKELIFLQFLFWVGVVVLKELIFNNFYFGRVWWS